jgi:hypothetical protein
MDFGSHSKQRIALASVQRVERVVARLRVVVGPDRPDFRIKPWAAKNESCIDAAERGDGESSILFGINWAPSAFELAHGCVTVDRHDEYVSLSG